MIISHSNLPHLVSPQVIQVPKIVVIDTDDLISGRLVVAGQVITVPDDYANVRRVLKTLVNEERQRNQRKREIGQRKLAKLLEEQYPQEWQRLNRPKNAEVLAELINWLNDKPNRITKALSDPEWLVKRIKAALRE